MLKTFDAVSALERIFDDVMGSTLGTAANPRGFAPEIDVRMNDDEVRTAGDVPGLKREDLDIVLENHILPIRGFRKFECAENEQVMLGRGYRLVRMPPGLPDLLDEERLNASPADGVLMSSVPRLPRRSRSRFVLETVPQP